MRKFIKKIIILSILLSNLVLSYAYADLAVGPIYDETDVIGVAIIVLISVIVLVIGIALGISIRNGIKNKENNEEIDINEESK